MAQLCLAGAETADQRDAAAAAVAVAAASETLEDCAVDAIDIITLFR